MAVCYFNMWEPRWWLKLFIIQLCLCLLKLSLSWQSQQKGRAVSSDTGNAHQQHRPARQMEHLQERVIASKPRTVITATVCKSIPRQWMTATSATTELMVDLNVNVVINILVKSLIRLQGIFQWPLLWNGCHKQRSKLPHQFIDQHSWKFQITFDIRMLQVLALSSCRMWCTK